MLVAAMFAMAEDVTLLGNHRQWGQLPTATLMRMGNDYINVRSMPDSALLCYSLIANRYSPDLKGDELKQCIRAIKHTGTIYMDFYTNHTEAYKRLLRAQELANKCHYDEFLPDVKMSIGSLYWRIEGLRHDNQHYKEALAWYKSAFWQAIKLHDYSKVPVIIINLNYVSFCKGELAQFAKERETFSHLEIPDSADLKYMAQVMNNAVQLFCNDRPEHAIKVFRQALSRNDKTTTLNRASIEVMLNEYICHTLLSMGRDEESLAALDEIQDIVLSELPAMIPGIYGQFAEYYRRHHNKVMADRYELLWLRSADSIATASGANSVNTVRFLHEIDKMNEEQQALTLKQRHDRQMLWMVSAFSLVAVVLLVLLYINRRRIQQDNQRLYEQSVQLLAADEELRHAGVEQDFRISKYSHNQMDDDVMDDLWLQIKRVMETSEEIYQDTFGIDQLAELLDAKKTISRRPSTPRPVNHSLRCLMSIAFVKPVAA